MRKVRERLGDYLADAEPAAALWLDLVDVVYRDSPRRAHPERLSKAARTLFYVGCFRGELINGGISQFFSNSAGDRTYATLGALDSVGATLSASLLRQALKLFPNGTAPADRERRCEALFAFEGRDPEFLRKLSKDFYGRVDVLGGQPEENLTALEVAFIRANAAAHVSAGLPDNA